MSNSPIHVGDRDALTPQGPVAAGDPANKHPGPSSRLGRLGWIILAGLWFMTIQVRPLLDPDEGRYAEIPREMAASGDWITPRLDDLKYFEKPPLQYWATAAAYRVFGEHPWSSRLWSTTLAFACLPMVFAWTRRLYGGRAADNALLALASSPYFALVGHLNLLDAGFTFWLTATVFAFSLAQLQAPGSAGERRWMRGTWLLAGLAVLSKGIVVGVLGVSSLIAYSLWERDLRPWKRLRLRAGLPWFLVITAPWFVLVAVRNPGFAEFFFVHEHFARFLTTVHQRVEPWWYFIPIVLVGTAPWLRPLADSLPAAWHDNTARHFKPLRFLLLFAAVSFLFFSSSGSKLAPYVLPLIPVLAAVAGAQAPVHYSLTRGVTLVGAGVVTVVALGLLLYCRIHNGSIPRAVLPWVLLGVGASWLALAATRSSAHAWRADGVVAAAAAIVSWQCLLVAYALTPPARSGEQLVTMIRPRVHAGTTLYSVGQYRQTLAPYLQRTLVVVGFEGELQFGLQAEPGRNAATWEEFQRRWNSASDALAFVDPAQWPRLQAQGLPGSIVAADGETLVVSRR